MKNALHFFQGFLQEISEPEYTFMTYSTKIKSEFIPRPTPKLVEISSNGSFLNIDCVSNVSDAIVN